MDRRIVQFIAALRAGGARISLAESEDAARAVRTIGVTHREAFRLALRGTLIKSAEHLPLFDRLFPLFFSPDTPPLLDPSRDLTPEEARLLAEALSRFGRQLREQLERLLHGEPLTRQELERLARLVGLQHADDLRYQRWMAERMMRALRFPEVRRALDDLLQILAEMGMNRDRLTQLIRQMAANQQALEAQIEQYAGQQIAGRMAQQSPPPADLEGLMQRPFHALSERDMALLRREVRRLAAALRSRIALRQKRARSGSLDVKATLRANLQHGSVPFRLKHRDHALKPKLVLLCDISTSMRYLAELMLSLTFELQDQVRKMHAFAFIDHLEYITPDFQGRRVDEAVQHVLRRMPAGYYNTDLGHALENFTADHLHTVDGRTTFLVVGDGRNNFSNPRLDLFREIACRARRTLWLNPEPPLLWGTGDSDMLAYAPLCDQVLQVGNLAELTRAIDRLMVG